MRKLRCRDSTRGHEFALARRLFPWPSRVNSTIISLYQYPPEPFRARHNSTASDRVRPATVTVKILSFFSPFTFFSLPLSIPRDQQNRLRFRGNSNVKNQSTCPCQRKIPGGRCTETKIRSGFMLQYNRAGCIERSPTEAARQLARRC